MVEAMDQELREKFARLEAQVEALQGIPQKLDSMIQLQVTMASVQESTRGQTEKLSELMTQLKSQSEQINAVNDKVSSLRHKIIGGAIVISIVVIPVSGFLIRESRDQLTTIDRRVTGLEFEVQRAKADR